MLFLLPILLHLDCSNPSKNINVLFVELAEDFEIYRGQGSCRDIWFSINKQKQPDRLTYHVFTQKSDDWGLYFGHVIFESSPFFTEHLIFLEYLFNYGTNKSYEWVPVKGITVCPSFTNDRSRPKVIFR